MFQAAFPRPGSGPRGGEAYPRSAREFRVAPRVSVSGAREVRPAARSSAPTSSIGDSDKPSLDRSRHATPELPRSGRFLRLAVSGLYRAKNTTVTFLQGPTNYCTAGTSASGCQASISAAGTASATAAPGFLLTASSVERAKDGLFFFGTNGRQANAWGNGTSFQCVVPPVTRGGVLPGQGTGGLCDGSFSQDLNTLWTAKPSKNPGAGALVQAQLWYRDPQNTLEPDAEPLGRDRVPGRATIAPSSATTSQSVAGGPAETPIVRVEATSRTTSPWTSVPPGLWPRCVASMDHTASRRNTWIVVRAALMFRARAGPGLGPQLAHRPAYAGQRAHGGQRVGGVRSTAPDGRLGATSSAAFDPDQPADGHLIPVVPERDAQPAVGMRRVGQ